MKTAQSSDDQTKITESENSRKAKRWFYSTLVLLIVLLIGTAAMVIFVDPYFHYHKPLSFLSYRIYEERYVNDGISRHFTYDAVITGTSMAQNFKTSELDELFGTHSVKEPFSGADFRELSENLNRTLQYGQEVKMVVMPLDYNALLQAADWQKYEEYPTYLYDNNIFNDARYVWNKAIFYHGVVADLLRTVSGEPSTTMDEYSSWVHETGLEHIMASYTRADQHPVEDPSFNEEDRRMVEENITKNIVDLVNRYPDTEFYFYYPPYSICYFDGLCLQNALTRQLEAERLTTELLLQCPNVKLYNFFDQTQVICNLDYYNDTVHYSAEVSSMILNWMKEGTGLITKDNYEQKLSEEADYFNHYDYDSIYAVLGEVTP